jgi:hypothetical protein
VTRPGRRAGLVGLGAPPRHGAEVAGSLRARARGGGDVAGSRHWRGKVEGGGGGNEAVGSLCAQAGAWWRWWCPSSLLSAPQPPLALFVARPLPSLLPLLTLRPLILTSRPSRPLVFTSSSRFLSRPSSSRRSHSCSTAARPHSCVKGWWLGVPVFLRSHVMPSRSLADPPVHLSLLSLPACLPCSSLSLPHPFRPSCSSFGPPAHFMPSLSPLGLLTHLPWCSSVFCGG